MFEMLTWNAPLITATIFLSVYLVRKLKTYTLARSPPGPRGWPVIGNISDIPHEKSWLTFTEWKKTYGDIVYVESFGSPTVILNNPEDIHELLDRRSAITSDRPRLVMANELLGWDWDFVHMRYGDRWREHRKVFHQYFQEKNVPVHFPVIRKAVVTLLDQFLKSPDNFGSHIRHFAGKIILKLTYDHNVETEDDYYVALADGALKELLKVIHVGSSIVEVMPILKYIPTWLPGAGFKTKALANAHYSSELRDIPFEQVKKRLNSGDIGSCFVSDNLEKGDVEDAVIRNAAGIAYLAGSDTTASALKSFILAMVHHPEVQARAREEIDSVTGGSRIPDFNDRSSLPYIGALISELLRWAPPTPLVLEAVPHQSVKPDIYKGYYFPAGTTFVPNVHGIFHDETQFSEPFKFKPERFLDENVGFDPIAMGAFGYGRRICPGRSVSLNSVWLAVVQILTVFTISPKRDKNGKAKLGPPEYTTGLVVHPVPFEADITPRSEKALELLRKMDLELEG